MIAIGDLVRLKGQEKTRFGVADFGGAANDLMLVYFDAEHVLCRVPDTVRAEAFEKCATQPPASFASLVWDKATRSLHVRGAHRLAVGMQARFKFASDGPPDCPALTVTQCDAGSASVGIAWVDLRGRYQSASVSFELLFAETGA